MEEVTSQPSVKQNILQKEATTQQQENAGVWNRIQLDQKAVYYLQGERWGKSLKCPAGNFLIYLGVGKTRAFEQKSDVVKTRHWK